MGINSANGGNSLNRASALKNAISKSKPKTGSAVEQSQIAADKPVAKQLISSFRFPSIKADDKAQILESNEKLGNSRADEALNLKDEAWSSANSPDIKFDPISKTNTDVDLSGESVESALNQLKEISDTTLDERSNSSIELFKINEEIN